MGEVEYPLVVERTADIASLSRGNYVDFRSKEMCRERKF